MKKVPATFDFEKSLWNKNKEYIVGIDEVGRGAWAGPLVAAAVIFPKNYNCRYKLFDSKLLNFLQREELAKTIQKEALCFGIGQTEVGEIEKLGLTQATQLSYMRALGKLDCQPDHYLIDAFYINSLERQNQTAIVHGDYLCASIAAASIVAKVFRDDLMRKFPQEYQPYKFDRNKGYGTKEHQEAILEIGLSDAHRSNYNLKILQ